MERGDARRLPPEHLDTVRDILARLNASTPQRLGRPGRHGRPRLPASPAQRRHRGVPGRDGTCQLAHRLPLRGRPRRRRRLPRLPLEGTAMLMHDPPHPGAFIRRQCLEPLGLAVTEAAKGLAVSRNTLCDAAQRPARNFSRNGHPPLAGLRRQSGELVAAAVAIRSLAHAVGPRGGPGPPIRRGLTAARPRPLKNVRRTGQIVSNSKPDITSERTTSVPIPSLARVSARRSTTARASSASRGSSSGSVRAKSSKPLSWHTRHAASRFAGSGGRNRSRSSVVNMALPGGA